MPRISATTGSEPAGTPAVPIPPRMQTSSTITCCHRVSSTPKNWARNSTVTPSNIAVPFWLAVAPMVSTKRETRRRQLQLLLGDAQRGRQGRVGRGGREGHHHRLLDLAEEGERGHRRPNSAQRQRIDDEHVEAEREQDDADIGAEPDQQVPAEQGGEVEHEAGDRDRRQVDDDADQLHRHVEQALDRLLQPTCAPGVSTSSRPMPKISAKNITERMSLSRGGA